MCTTCGCHTPLPAMPAPLPDTSWESRLVHLEADLLASNDAQAARNRQLLQRAGVRALNLMSSPGAGKTTLLVDTIRRLQGKMPVAVIEGDQQTRLDAERIEATGVPVTQINTGKGCHLDARMVHQGLMQLPLLPEGVLLIENVGNLVCPAAFDLGEHHKVVVFSVTEGEDKPLKYPDMFRAADVLVLNKCDLLPHVRFDVSRALDYARQIRPDVQIFQLSATEGSGMDAWVDWLRARVRA